MEQIYGGEFGVNYNFPLALNENVTMIIYLNTYVNRNSSNGNKIITLIIGVIKNMSQKKKRAK